jgi:hypothetical protein
MPSGTGKKVWSMRLIVSYQLDKLYLILTMHSTERRARDSDAAYWYQEAKRGASWSTQHFAGGSICLSWRESSLGKEDCTIKQAVISLSGAGVVIDLSPYTTEIHRSSITTLADLLDMEGECKSLFLGHRS